MDITKCTVKTDAVIPLMAALPYGVSLDPTGEEAMVYDPTTQLSHFAGQNFSTSRYDESVGGILSKSRSDTKKDD